MGRDYIASLLGCSGLWRVSSTWRTLEVRLYRGQLFENLSLNQEAMVTDIRNAGRNALLKYLVGDNEKWVSVEEVIVSGEWRLKRSSNDEGPAPQP
jgi:hypothetical protein